MSSESKPVDQRAEGKTTPEDGSQPPGRLAPALAVLRGIFRELVPSDPLGPGTVPSGVLAVAIDMAIEEFVEHSKTCTKLACSFFPSPLQIYRRQRPSAIRKYREQIHRSLWTHPDSGLVTAVRDRILRENEVLAREARSGALLENDRLEKVLGEGGQPAARALVAVLWASRFEGPEAVAIFKSAAPLAQRESGGPGKPKRPREEEETRDLKSRLRGALMELKETRHARDQAVHALEVIQRKYEKLRGEFGAAMRKHGEVSEELRRTEKILGDARIAYQLLESDAKRAAKVNDDLRRDLHRHQEASQDLEAERADLASKLGKARREVESLSFRLESLPRGERAVWRFLKEEKKRITINRRILEGGARERASAEWTAYRKLRRAFLVAYPKYLEPPPRKVRRPNPLRFLALGGADEVGRSCYVLELGKHKILVDCGIKPDGSQGVPPAIGQLEHLDALILTHAHTDHVGWVPALIRRFPELDIYCSTGTAALLPVVLEDCQTQYVRKLAALRKRSQYIANADAVEEEYGEEDVHTVTQLVSACEFDQEERLPFGGISLSFFRAGHILGAASVLVEDMSGRRIFLSGDFSSFPQLTISAAQWPDSLGEVDLLVLESTYGDRTHPPVEGSRRELVGFIREVTQVERGSVILASFAVGRAQELLKLIVTAREERELDDAVPLYVDGMIKKINPIYRRLAQFDLPNNSFYEVSGEQERREIASSAVDTPCIIITTSGMLNGGPVVEYAQHLLPNPRNRIVLTGFQDEGAPSRALYDITQEGRSTRVVQLVGENGEPVQFASATRAKDIRLSAHADQVGLREYAARVNARCIALVHGERQPQETLRSSLQRSHPKAEIHCGPIELELP